MSDRFAAEAGVGAERGAAKIYKPGPRWPRHPLPHRAGPPVAGQLAGDVDRNENRQYVYGAVFVRRTADPVRRQHRRRPAPQLPAATCASRGPHGGRSRSSSVLIPPSGVTHPGATGSSFT
jgi:hypothetical protein